MFVLGDDREHSIDSRDFGDVPQGTEFVVNTFTAWDQYDSSVAMDAAGEVQASATGDFDVALEVAEPPAETWEFQWRAGQDASVGSRAMPDRPTRT